MPACSSIPRDRLDVGPVVGVYVPPDPTAAMHKSLTAAWWPAEFIPKRHYNWQTKQEERRINVSAGVQFRRVRLIHQSAYQR